MNMMREGNASDDEDDDDHNDENVQYTNSSLRPRLVHHSPQDMWICSEECSSA